jgi:leucyl-tRNA synthetase
MRDIGLTTASEPFRNLLTQGMVCKETHKCNEHGWLLPDEVKDSKCIKCGCDAECGRVEKMSKSKKNVIDPDYLINRYGSDTARLFSLFAAPPERDLEWSDKGVDGAHRFLGRLWNLVHNNLDRLKNANGDPETVTPLLRKTHQTIKRVTNDIEREFHFNTAIAAMMELVNEASSFEPASEEDSITLRTALETVLLLLSPFSPHIAEEIWEEIGNNPTIFDQPWPLWDEEIAKQEEIELVIQVNGKVRAKAMVPAGLPDDELKKIALEDPKIKALSEEKPIKKVFVVRGRLVNLVV